MPRLLGARPPQDDREAAQIRQLAVSRHAPADWCRRAQRMERRWAGHRPPALAAAVGGHPQTVRERIARCNAEGVDGLGDRPRRGRTRRRTEDERGRILALVATDPPGKLVRQAEGPRAAAAAGGSLDGLAATAPAAGIAVTRSQVRRILVAEGVRWRRPHSWATSAGPDLVPQGRRSSGSPRPRPPARRASTWTRSGR
jgi:transposase